MISLTLLVPNGSAFLATPMELLKVQLQMQLQSNAAERQFKGPFDCARSIVQARGAQGLWTALPSSLIYRCNFLWMFGSFEVRVLSKLYV